MRLIRLLTGLWTLVAAALANLASPSVYAALGPLSRGQVRAVASAWTSTTAVIAVAGVVGMLRGIRAGRHACVVALMMATVFLLAMPLISLGVDPARAYPRSGAIAVVNLAAAYLLSWSACR